MYAVWVDISIGEIVDEEGKPTLEGEEVVDIIEKPRFTERSEITFTEEVSFLNSNIEAILLNLLSLSVHRINNALTNETMRKAINNTEDSDGEES